MDIIGCELSHNQAGDSGASRNTPQGGDGGGLYCYRGAVFIIDSIFYSNHAGDASDADYYGGNGGCGGGIYAESETQNIFNSIICHNTAGDGGAGSDGGGDGGDGAGIYVVEGDLLQVVNSLVYSNTCGNGATSSTSGGDGGDGGGIFGYYFHLINCTIAENSAGVPQGDGIMNPGRDGVAGGVYSIGNSTVANCILWNNQTAAGSAEESQMAGSLTINYSCVQGWSGSYGGTGNIGDDPLFLDPDGPDDEPLTWEDNNYRLNSTSPCIEKGDVNFLPSDEYDLDNDGDTSEKIPIDLDGAPRVQNSPFSAGDTVDMGAHEFPEVDCNNNSIWDPLEIILGPVLYVDQNAAGNESGESWANAFTDLQAALCVARIYPDIVQEIRVARGIYKPDQGSGNRSDTFELIDGLKMYGGFAPGETTLDKRDFVSNPVVLSGDLAGDDLGGNYSDNSYQVVTATGLGPDTGLDGFTISGAVRSGFKCTSSNFDVLNCVFQDNQSQNKGGGVLIEGAGGAMAFIGCHFEDNSARYGGAVAAAGILNITRSTFVNNLALADGGAVQVVGGRVLFDESCRFTANTADQNGGALYLDNCSVQLQKSIFEGNSASLEGGAVWSEEGSLNSLGSTYAGNHATWYGGAISSLNTAMNSFNDVFSGNSAGNSGGVLQCTSQTVKIINSSFYGNFIADIISGPTATAVILMDDSDVTVTNSILWGNETWDTFDDNPQFIVLGGSDPTVTYSCVMDSHAGDGTVYPGAGNIDLDPEFLDPDGQDDILGTGDDSLMPFVTSPVIDAGNNAAVLPEFTQDIRGLDRFYDNELTVDTGAGLPPIVDMGAYEFQGTIVYVMDEILPPEEIRSRVRYDGPAHAPGISDPGLAFRHPSSDPVYENHIYAAAPGLVDIGWTVAGQIEKVTETYFIAPIAPTVSVYRSDRNQSPQVDMTKVFNHVPPLEVIFHSNNTIRGGKIYATDDDPPDVGFIYISDFSDPEPRLYATKAGRILIEYRQADPPHAPVAFEYVEIKDPRPAIMEVEVGDMLMPSSAEMWDTITQPRVSRGLSNFIFRQDDKGPTQHRCYSIRPTDSSLDAEIYWFKTPLAWAPGRSGRVEIGVEWPTDIFRYVSDWPENPLYKLHADIANLPPAIASDHDYIKIEYSEPLNQLTLSEHDKITSTKSGWATVRYLDDVADGGKWTRIEVVRTVEHDDPIFGDGVNSPEIINWWIGDRITHASHEEFCLPTGFIFSGENYDPSLYDEEIFADPSKYDGSDKAIFPVNLGKMEIWFYQKSMDTCWPVKPVVFDCQWPLQPDDCIVISNQNGSQSYNNPTVYKEPIIYYQNDPHEIGFNPNEEHARWHAQPGDRIFAARDDLAAASGESEPYVLVRYKDGLNDDKYEYDVIGVVRSGLEASITGCPCTEEPCDFVYSASAGTPLLPPIPLLFDQTQCPKTTFTFNEEDGPIREWTDALMNKTDENIHIFTLDPHLILIGEIYPLGSLPFFEMPKFEIQLSADLSILLETFNREIVGGGMRFECDLRDSLNEVAYPFGAPGEIKIKIAADSPTNSGDYLLKIQQVIPKQQIFWNDLKGNKWFRRGDVTVTSLYEESWEGECTAWLDGGMGGSEAQRVEWNVNWPQIPSSTLNPPGSSKNVYTTLSFGQTRDRSGYQRVEILYNTSGATLIMPWKESFVEYHGPGDDPGINLPPDYTERHYRLPIHIRKRFSYDILNDILVFKGLKPAGPGESGLLGIMSPQDKQVIFEVFDQPGPEYVHFRAKVEQLYTATQQETTLASSVGYTVGLPDIDNPAESNSRYHPEWSPEWGVAVSAGSASEEGWFVLGYNGLPTIGEPADVEVFRVQCPPQPGHIAVIYPDCPFDEQLTLRWSGDCGGDCDNLDFYWQVAAGFNPDDYEDVGADAPPGWEPPGWEDYEDPLLGGATGWQQGQNEIIIKGANIRTLTDNWFRVKFRDRSDNGLVCGASSESDWTEAQLAEGWIKRVKRQLNPFDQRMKNFTESRVATYVNMIEQLGPPYEDKIPFTCNAEILNGLGLIEAYQGVLYRGRSFTLDLGINYAPANQALILIAGGLADFHMLLANEAYGDAQDPTIAIDVDMNLASTSMFCFQDQLPSNENSLLYEELALLRGRDGRSGTSFSRTPVYNRLYWNFTSGDGQVAYKSNYNIHDVYPMNPDGSRGDGFINENDAKVMFPQGHGDAWGHYLTASKSYYNLLRDPNFDWPVRSEAVLVGQVPIQVSFAHERKFAKTAAAKAKCGVEILDLTLREQYTEDPSLQWRGYPDYVEGRHWGVTQWARRSFQGAYFDWVVANANVPAIDDAPSRKGTVKQIDRRNLQGLHELVVHADEISSILTEADEGLNPLGLGKNVVPFDITPPDETGGNTHFEQIYNRALVTLDNAISIFNHANQASQHLRRNQDTQQDFENNVEDKEADYNSRLIEIFGYPYPDAINPRTGAKYGVSYNGPDLSHWMYIDVARLTGLTEEDGDNALPQGEIIAVPFRTQTVNADGTISQITREVDFYMVPGFGLIKPGSFELDRRAPGEIQLARGNLINSWWNLRKSIKAHDDALLNVEIQSQNLQSLLGLRDRELTIAWANFGQHTTLNGLISIAKLAQITFLQAGGLAEGLSEVGKTGTPSVVGVANDVFSAVRASLTGAGKISKGAFEALAGYTEMIQTGLNFTKETIDRGLQIDTIYANRAYEQTLGVRNLELLIEDMMAKQMAVYAQIEEVRQAAGKYRVVVARGERLLAEREAFRLAIAEKVSNARYKDMAFRIFRNDALQKYRSQFDLSAQYVYLAAKAYGYETNLLDFDQRSGERILERIAGERTLGQIADGPQIGPGLAGILGELNSNFQSLKGVLGFNNPTISTDKFSLRRENYRSHTDEEWRLALKEGVVRDLRTQVPEFNEFCTSFQPYSDYDPANPHNSGEPAVVLHFRSTINARENFFGREGSTVGGESFYPSDHYAIKIRGVGIWFAGYADSAAGLVSTPRCYLIPAGADLMRVPGAETVRSERRVREWFILDQLLPQPYPLGEAAFIPRRNGWIPSDQLPGALLEPRSRRYASLRVHHDSQQGLGGISAGDFQTTTTLVGRSVWNTNWVLIIPGRFLLQGDPHEGIRRFIEGMDGSGGISDIRLAFQTYQYASGAGKPEDDTPVVIENGQNDQ
jgi:hypothetical protein